MEKLDFKRGHKVFKEDFSRVTGLYFITQGEFEITRSIDVSNIKSQLKPAKRALSRGNSDLPTGNHSSGSMVG